MFNFFLYNNYYIKISIMSFNRKASNNTTTNNEGEDKQPHNNTRRFD